MREVCREEEALFGGADCGSREAGRTRHAGRRGDSPDRHLGATFYRWKKEYSGLQSDQVRELKQLQDENARLKKLVAELSLDKAILQDVAAKNWLGPR